MIFNFSIVSSHFASSCFASFRFVSFVLFRVPRASQPLLLAFGGFYDFEELFRFQGRAANQPAVNVGLSEQFGGVAPP